MRQRDRRLPKIEDILTADRRNPRICRGDRLFAEAFELFVILGGVVFFVVLPLCVLSLYLSVLSLYLSVLSLKALKTINRRTLGGSSALP